MNHLPLISVIMPVFNCEKFVEKSIASIIDQTYRNWELLICDDASTDQTYRLINSFSDHPQIKIFQNNCNLKLLKTRNNLLYSSKGELITFQDGDDYSDKLRFEKMVEEFQRNHRLGLLASQVAYVDVKGRLLRVSRKPTDYNATLATMSETNAVGGSIMMIRREALQAVGGKFREYFEGLSYQDYDLSLLIAEKYEAYSLPDTLYYYRQHATSASKVVSVDRAICREVVRHLALQRRQKGSDDLMDGNDGRVDAHFAALRTPYLNDRSLIYREYAANFVYNKLFWKAVITAWNAVKKRPLCWTNWRTLQYCFRKLLFHKLFLWL